MKKILPCWLILTVATTGCSTFHVGSGRAERISQHDGATVISGEELAQRSGSVLEALVGKVPNMKVDFVELDRCPAITMRSHHDLHGANFPDVYVDGTRSTNTCVLQSLRAHDAARVEIYPMGFTTRPGYGTSADGLILVFLRHR